MSIRKPLILFMRILITILMIRMRLSMRFLLGLVLILLIKRSSSIPIKVERISLFFLPIARPLLNAFPLLVFSKTNFSLFLKIHYLSWLNIIPTGISLNSHQKHIMSPRKSVLISLIRRNLCLLLSK